MFAVVLEKLYCSIKEVILLCLEITLKLSWLPAVIWNNFYNEYYPGGQGQNALPVHYHPVFRFFWLYFLFLQSYIFVSLIIIVIVSLLPAYIALPPFICPWIPSLYLRCNLELWYFHYYFHHYHFWAVICFCWLGLIIVLVTESTNLISKNNDTC